MTALMPVDTDVQSLELDPVGYMATVLHRAKSWLDEATNIDDVRNAKAIAVGMENVIREKEMAFDAQLAATEIVRRCERRVGELVRKGQEDGTIRGRGHVLSQGNTRSPVDFLPSAKERVDAYDFAEANVEEFDRAIEDAKAEGNLSRANVIRKVKGDKKPEPERSEWHRKKRHIDSNRIVERFAGELDAACSGLDLIDPESIDMEVKLAAISSIQNSIKTIQKEMRRW